jgi:Co/Zn/Cd efflux system component
VLWIALVANALMFLVEIFGGVTSGSVSLLADSIDFFGDAGNYALSLAVLAWAGRRRRGRAVQGGDDGGCSASRCWRGPPGAACGRRRRSPRPWARWAAGAGGPTSGVAVLLYAYREGDANMRSVWLCTRNDAIGNVAVLLAALGVFGTGSRWPDLLVAAVMAGLALSAG